MSQIQDNLQNELSKLISVSIQADKASVVYKYKADLHSVSLARHQTDELQGTFPHLPWDNIHLLVTELVTNAICYGSNTGDWVEVSFCIKENICRVEVTNSDPPFKLPDLKAMPGFEDVHGRGLWLVNKLSNSWGMKGSKHAKVWFECAAELSTDY